MIDFHEFRKSLSEARNSSSEKYYYNRNYWSGNVEYGMDDYPEFSDLKFPKFSPPELKKISAASAKKMGDSNLQKMIKSLKIDFDIVEDLEHEIRSVIQTLDSESGDPDWKTNRKALVSFHKEVKQQVKMTSDKIKLLGGIPNKDQEDLKALNKKLKDLSNQVVKLKMPRDERKSKMLDKEQDKVIREIEKLEKKIKRSRN